ncbi:MAG: tryptophan 7-halogenase [Geminicoccaceae bacterium]|nr:tryptophan 7-halogenase [Geminicoccaceae bacterium]
MQTRPPRFVIVGGGTAGWLAALMIRDAARRAAMPIHLTVVESSRIPTIGVGEGTTAVFRMMLRHFGFDEAEFLRATGATIKFGIRHRDWRTTGHTYDGPIDDPHQVLGDTNGSWLDIHQVAAGRSVAETHLFAALLDREKSPYARKPDGSLVAAGPFHHAYHFDQALVGQYLRTKARDIAVVDAEVRGCRMEEDGIAALITDNAGEIEGDFFIDCSGFRRVLIERQMGATWTSFADVLPVNRAMPFWLEIREDDEIPPYTLAWAQGSGWMWTIPTRYRLGCGYVYDDSFIGPDEARAEIEAALGRSIEPRADLRFETGRLTSPWIGNCLALGLASSFLEPLEATSIHGTIVQLMIFTHFHLKSPAAMTEADRRSYNAAVARQVDDFSDFINLHYVSEREDTPFWRAMRHERIGLTTRERLHRWRSKMPSAADFAEFPGRFPHIQQQLHYPVLDGLGLLSRKIARAEMAARPRLSAHARATARSLIAEYRHAAGRTLGHRAFLESL